MPKPGTPTSSRARPVARRPGRRQIGLGHIMIPAGRNPLGRTTHRGRAVAQTRSRDDQTKADIGRRREADRFMLRSAARRRRGRTAVREDWALVAVVCGAGWGGDWSGSSWSIPIASVVPMSL